MEVIDDLRFRRSQVEDTWNAVVAKIRTNPNQLNVRWIGQADQLADMLRAQAQVVALDVAIELVKHRLSASSRGRPRRRQLRPAKKTRR